MARRTDGLRWTAAAILEAVKGFRRSKGHKDLPKLVAALRVRDQQIGFAVSVETKGFNLNPTGWVFVPDLSRRPVQDQITKDSANRVTWQATPKQKFAAMYEYNDKLDNHAAGGAFGADQATYIQEYTPKIFQPTAGSSWLVPTQILGARLPKLGLQIDT